MHTQILQGFLAHSPVVISEVSDTVLILLYTCILAHIYGLRVSYLSSASEACWFALSLIHYLFTLQACEVGTHHHHRTNLESTLVQHHDVESTLIPSCFNSIQFIYLGSNKTFGLKQNKFIALYIGDGNTFENSMLHKNMRQRCR